MSQEPASADHGRPRRPQIADFRTWCARVTEDELTAPEAMYRWSVAHYRTFWRAFLGWSELAWEGCAEEVCTSDDVETAVFFPGVRLNYAENLLRPLPDVDDQSVAVTSVHGDGRVENITRGRLRRRVQTAATALSGYGVQPGHRVVVVSTNNASAVITSLAVTALGAAVSNAMPDMGPTALLGRFAQIEPIMLVLDRGGATAWEGAEGDTLDTLLQGLPTLRRVLVVDERPLPATGDIPVDRVDLEHEDPGSAPTPWQRVPFNAPAFVLFSSGTTGPPKAIVHGVGGTLLEHVKEHRLHLDVGPGDTFFHHTTTAWMVWNRQLSALAAGARIVTFDGPIRGPEVLWRLVAEHGVTVFGSSPPYLQLCQDAGYRPGADVDLSRLRSVCVTGSVLHDWQYDWFGEAVGPQPLQSLGGGTDIIGAWVLGHPELPVRRGRIQTRSLGMDVAALGEDGQELVGEIGELVSRQPFPSRPIGFLGDPDGRRYHEAYFAQNPGMWTHGDLIDIDSSGSPRLHGRSDGVMNIDGVRIGPTEVYAVLRSIPQIREAMAVEADDPERPGSTRLVLLVVLRPGEELDNDLAATIRSQLRHQASAAHVPSLVLAVPEIPVTHNGKPSERAARDALNGRVPLNLSALRNPGVVEAIAAALAASSRSTVAEDGHPLPADADGDAIAAAITRLWCQTLGPAADAEHTFEDLGGTSREVMSLVRQVRQVVGRDVLVDAFLANPTLPGLIEAARSAPRAADAATVLPMAPGEAGLPPLFIIQDVYGDLDVYWAAAQLLTGTGPVHGLRTHVRDSDGRRRSIDQLARTHVEQIEETAPIGPVRLAGYSFGGQVAYQTARLLTEAGRAVEQVVLIDTRPSPTSMTPFERALNGLGDRLALLFPSIGNVRLRQVLDLRFRPGSVDGDSLLFDEAVRMVNDTRPGPYDGAVTLLLARRRLPLVQRWLPAWRRLAPRLQVMPIPGAHHEVLGQANVVETAARFSDALAGTREAVRS